MKINTIGRSLILILLLAGCEDWLSDPEPSVDDVPLSEIVDVERAGEPLPLAADGVSADSIFAFLPLDARTRIVKFTTTAGSFDLTGGQRTVDVRAVRTEDGMRLRASAVLIADTVAVTAVVRGTVGEFSDFVLVPFIK
jgi:hypothetical protein